MILGYDHGYGELSNKMIELFRSACPDFAAAEELIKKGVDLNAEGTDEDENLLSVILREYAFSSYDVRDEGLGYCGDDYDFEANYFNFFSGPTMCRIIRFFLDHGFDVTKNNGRYGSQCLIALAFSCYDRYMIEAAKMLLDAGAKDGSIEQSIDGDTPILYVIGESDFQSNEGNHSLANKYDTIHQIYQAVEDKRPYSGIDSCDSALGKKITMVLAESDGTRPVFSPLSYEAFQKEPCFTQKLYFVYDGGALVINSDVELWTDTFLPKTGLMDVSRAFHGVIGSTIEEISFAKRGYQKDKITYGQPIAILTMDSGRKILFSHNFGEVKEEDFAAYYEFIDTVVVF